MTGNRSISAAIITLPLIAFAIYAAIVAVTAIGPTIWDSWSAHKARHDADANRVASIELSGREMSYASACPAYFEASFMDKLIGYRYLSWCADYEDKMPK